jgi:hypothetical protein
VDARVGLVDGEVARVGGREDAPPRVGVDPGPEAGPAESSTGEHATRSMEAQAASHASLFLLTARGKCSTHADALSLLVTLSF